MERDIYFEILARLAQVGLGNSADISELVRDYFRQNLDVWQDNLAIAVDAYLQLMDECGHADFSNKSEGNRDLSKISVTASILPDGLFFYYKKLEIESLIAVNNSTLESNRQSGISSNIQTRNISTQTRILAIASFFALCSFATSVFTLIRDPGKKAQQVEINRLRQDSTILRKQISELRLNRK